MTSANPQSVPPATAQAPFQVVVLDEAGFLADQRSWTPAVAETLATQAGLDELGRMHWLIIDFIRDRYLRLGGPPPMRHLCRRLGIERAEVKQAFGSCRVLWRVAGLPHPGEETLAYMD
jgi:tRNA 2-thiouridine synthesizing protein E